MKKQGIPFSELPWHNRWTGKQKMDVVPELQELTPYSRMVNTSSIGHVHNHLIHSRLSSVYER